MTQGATLAQSVPTFGATVF